MIYPVKVMKIDFALPILDIKGLENYKAVQLLVTFEKQPVGYCTLTIKNNEISRKCIIANILEKHQLKIIQCLLKKGLASPLRQGELNLEGLLALEPVEPAVKLPLVTVAICTKDRTEQLDRCLEAMSLLDYPDLDLLVVDNAPSTDATEILIKTKHPNFRYIREQNPGLNWARNRAILEARGEILAFTDDDVLVDANWVKSLGRLFARNPEVVALTGLVVPAELETQPQVMFETYGGFGRGFERKWHRVKGKVVPWQLLGTGQFGTGANMAFRKSIFQELGLFDPALDAGTLTNGGGDLEMFFRVIKHGYTLVYEPAAMVRHCHRKTDQELKTQISNNSKGLLGYISSSFLKYPAQRFGFFRIWFWYLFNWLLRRLLVSKIKAGGIPSSLVKAEISGCFRFGLYKKARKVAKQYDSQSGAERFRFYETPKIPNKNTKKGTAVRIIDLSEPIKPLIDIEDYPKTRIFFKWGENFLGHLDVTNHYTILGSERIAELVAKEFKLKLLQPSLNLSPSEIWGKATEVLLHHFDLDEDGKRPVDSPLSPSTASVVIATLDRPTDLYECLTSLCRQETSHRLEVVVVDNQPASGLTPPVVAQFPNVILVDEARKGLSYARNAGIFASTGEFILTTDDDVILPEHWVEDLLKPFVRGDVMAVTGNVLPHSLENDAQLHFELYGGLGKGYVQKEYDTHWFGSFRNQAVPTWDIGACANAAFRREVFKNKNIRMLEEVLGPGMPSGVGEDTYLFYRILKEGASIIYNPKAYVWHKHRKTNKALRRQLYNYSKGHVSYHLVTAIQDKDWRGLPRILYTLPKHHLARIIRRAIGRSDYPIVLILIEIVGNTFGPMALLFSWLKVKHLGKSEPYEMITSESNLDKAPDLN